MAFLKCCFDPAELSEMFDTLHQNYTDPGCKYIFIFIWSVFNKVKYTNETLKGRSTFKNCFTSDN